MRSSLFVTIFVVAVISLIGFSSHNAYADNLVKNATFPVSIIVGGSTTVGFKLVATNAGGDDDNHHSDTINGCNVSTSNPATVNFHLPLGVTSDPTTLTFTSCSSNTYTPVVFSSTKVGIYLIIPTISGPGKYHTAPSLFVLIVKPVVPVRDKLPPVIAFHGDVNVEATGASGATGTYTPPATSDNVDPPGTATCTPPSGTLFAIGSTLVTCYAEDAAGNTAIPTTFNVIVKDTTPPVIAPHDDVNVEATGASGATGSYTPPTTSDAVDGTGAATCVPPSGSLFVIGSTPVICSATDAAGNTGATSTFNVIVSAITANINNTSPKWGKPVQISGTAGGFNGTDSIIIKWGDGKTDTIPATASWAEPHTYGSGSVGVNTANATLVSHDSIVKASSPNIVINIQKHSTQLVLNQFNDVVAGTGVSAIGNLTDTDTGTGVDGKQITFTGSGATTLLPVNTQGIEFKGTGIAINDCPTCTPSLGSTNILHMHVGDYIIFPSGTVGVAFTLQDMGTNGFEIKVTNKDGVQSVYSGAGVAPDIAVFSPPSDLAGIVNIEMTSGSDLGISEIQTANPGGDPTTIYQASFGGFTPGTYENGLKVLTGNYFSIGLTPSSPTLGLTVQATFTEDSAYLSSTSNTLSFNTITPTFGVGGSETTGVIINTATPFTSVFCSKADPDDDRDSLCNSWESGPGIPYTVGASTFHYPLTGANYHHKDVFVEADAMTGVWSATYQNAINDVITAFSKAPLTKATQPQQKNPDGTNGINLHVIVDETGLVKTNALNVWTDTDTTQTNDYFSIKGTHFGTNTEHPTVSGTQTNGGVSTASTSKTLTVTGLFLTTPTLTTTKGDNSGSQAQGTISIKQSVIFGVPVTVTTPIAAPSMSGQTTAGITWGTPSATILSGAGTATQTIQITIPFTTNGPVTTASIGTVSVHLTISASTTVVSVVTSNNSPSVSDTLLQAKGQAFRYALFADCIVSCGLGSNPSGLAEQVGTPKAGNDIIVGIGPESGFTTTQNNIAGTFMHELGHTLGLQHGGPQYTYSGSTKTLVADSSQNCKPNYESVMSYSRQFTNYLGAAWNLNYSSGTFGPLTETSLSEPAGLVGNPTILSTPPTIVYGYLTGGVYKGTTTVTVNTGQANPGIDWDKSGTATGTGLSLPIQDLGITGCNTATALSSPISDYNDWLNLNYNFTTSGSFNGGEPDPVTIPEITQTINSQQNPSVTPHFIAKWGSSGTGTGQLKTPTGVTVGSSGNVYVADTGNNRVQEFSNTGTFITKWGTSGSGSIQFNNPSGIAVGSTGSVYVSDTGNKRIQEFKNDGTFITKWGTSGSGNNQFNNPTGIAIGSTGNVYVADSGNNRVQVFTKDGTFITKWGSLGTANGQFKNPNGVAVDSSGNVYVSDTGNSRIEKFSNTGAFITKWGTSGSSDGKFNTPYGIAVDSFGNVYVSDKENDRIQEFKNDGTFITKWGTGGSGNNQFDDPSATALDSSGNSYIADTNNNRISKWGP